VNILVVGSGNSVFITRQIQELQNCGVEISILPGLGRHRFLATILLQAGFTFHLPREVKRTVRQSDLIHFQWPGHWIYLANLALKLHKPAILSLRGRQINILPHLPDHQNFTRRLHKFLPKCCAYHCVSRAILEEAIPLGLKKDRAYVIRPAVDPAIFTPSETRPPATPMRVIMVGALMWRKGYDYAFLGIRKAITEGLNLQVDIIGDGPDINRLSYMITELDLKDNVHLLGKKPPVEVKQLMQSSHVLLHTSLSEGIANVVLEAMSCELAVITTDAGGINEVIRDHENGLLIPTRDPESVAVKLREVYNDQALRTRLGKNARQSVIKNHTLEQQADQFVRMYKEVLDKYGEKIS
jgi:colanic acid/amylovoran biosynthesis glycosyltransferase